MYFLYKSPGGTYTVPEHTGTLVLFFVPPDHRSEAGEENMKKNQEMLWYYCGQLQSEWAQKKALAYLRILAEAEGGVMGTDEPEKESTEHRVQSTDDKVIT